VDHRPDHSLVSYHDNQRSDRRLPSGFLLISVFQIGVQPTSSPRAHAQGSKSSFGVDTPRASSWTCTSLRDFCQRNLFARIILDVGSSDEERGKRSPCDRLVEVLTEFAHLVSYVRNLALLDEARCDSLPASALRILAKAPTTVFTCTNDGWVIWESNPEGTRAVMFLKIGSRIVTEKPNGLSCSPSLLCAPQSMSATVGKVIHFGWHTAMRTEQGLKLDFAQSSFLFSHHRTLLNSIGTRYRHGGIVEAKVNSQLSICIIIIARYTSIRREPENSNEWTCAMTAWHYYGVSDRAYQSMAKVRTSIQLEIAHGRAPSAWSSTASK
jgi:hypothetical protein